MIPTRKQSEPFSFKNAKRNNQELTYEIFSDAKEHKPAFLELRTSLLQEQGHICCYCQSKIKKVLNHNGVPLMKTEHFIPKSGEEADTSKQLRYNNLLAACRGNNDTSELKNRCDSSKGKVRLKVLPNPAEIRQPNYNHLFRYKERNRSGYVDVIPVDKNNEELKKDIEIRLNLNEQNLRTKRYAVWKGIWNIVYRRDRLNTHRLIAILDDHDFTKTIEPSKRDFKEFCGFITQWFESRFKDELEKARK